MRLIPSLLFFIVLGIVVPAYSLTNGIVIGNALPVVFSNIKLVKIQKGDNIAFTNVAYPDADWPVVSLPSSWDPAVFPGHSGFCWYRIHIRFPSALPENALGISLGEIYLADETYFNGHLIGKTGQFSNWVVSRHNQDRIYEIPTKYILPGKDNVVSIRIQGFIPDEAGPISGDFRIDRYSSLLTQYLGREFLKFIFVIIYLIISIYFLLFYIRRPADREHFFFGLFNLMFAMYYFFRNDLRYYLFDFNHLQMEYTLLFLLFPFFMSFILTYFRRKHRWYHYAFYGTTAAGILIIWLTQSPYIWKIVNLRFIQFTWIVPIGTVFYVLIREFRRQKDARLMVYAFTVFIVFMIHDILFNRALLTDEFTRKYGFFSQYIFALFVAFIAVILSDKFVQLNRQIQTLNKSLMDNYERIANINVELEQKVRDRTSELEKLNKKLEKNAKTDTLTGLNNRHEMETRLQEEISRIVRYQDIYKEYLSLLFIDLDHFKYYNDTFGHEIGDMILKHFSTIMKISTRSVDLVSRFGGDEFIITTVSTDPQEASILAKRIQDNLLKKNNFKAEIEKHLGYPVNIPEENALGCSIGISSFNRGVVNYDQMIKKADKALYEAKKQGRNKFVIYNENIV